MTSGQLRPEGCPAGGRDGVCLSVAATWAGGLAGRKQRLWGVQGMVGEMTIQDLDPGVRDGPLLV